MDTLLMSYVESTPCFSAVERNIGDLLDLPEEPSLQEQFKALCSITNYHWHGYVNESNKLKVEQSIAIQRHALNNEKYLCTSPRNRLMYCVQKGLNMVLKYTLQFIQELDSDQEHQQHQAEIQPPPKKRRLLAKAKKISNSTISANLPGDVAQLLDEGSVERSIYSDFKNFLYTRAVLKWRFHDNVMDICVMNDYDSQTGLFTPNSFVHVTCLYMSNGIQTITCTCNVYHFMERLLLRERLEEDDQELIPDATTSCLHCRLFKEELLNAYDRISVLNEKDLNRALHTMKNSLQFINEPVQLLGSVVPSSATKFSVQAEDSVALVTVSFDIGRCYIKCHSGMCVATTLNKKRMPKSKKLSLSGDFCRHLTTVNQNIDSVRKFFPDFFEENAVEEEEEESEEQK